MKYAFTNALAFVAGTALLGSAQTGSDQSVSIRIQQSYLDLDHGLGIEIQVMRIDPGAEQIWERSFSTVQTYLPECAQFYEMAHNLIPALDRAFRARDIVTANALAKQAADYLAQAENCSNQTDVFASGAAPGDDSRPAATNLQQANAIAGDIIDALKLVFGTEEIDKLSTPQSHASNAQSAVRLAISEYLNKVALGAIVARLTKGQLNNFIGGVGQKIMQDLFPNSVPQAVIKEVPGRTVDLLDPVNRIVREVKTGAPNAMSSFVQNQIANDARLVQAGYKVEWWNVRSPFGKQEFSPALVDALQKVGITPVSHINP